MTSFRTIVIYMLDGLGLFWAGFKETWGGGAWLIAIAVATIIICVILVEVFS